jgi:hypothetical protein
MKRMNTDIKIRVVIIDNGLYAKDLGIGLEDTFL